MILVLRHGEVVQLENENQMRLTGPDPDIVIISKGKLLTLNGEQMMDDGVADLLLPLQSLSEITAEEKATGSGRPTRCSFFMPPFFQRFLKRPCELTKWIGKHNFLFF